jgi:hypothetical protein
MSWRCNTFAMLWASSVSPGYPRKRKNFKPRSPAKAPKGRAGFQNIQRKNPWRPRRPRRPAEARRGRAGLQDPQRGTPGRPRRPWMPAGPRTCLQGNQEDMLCTGQPGGGMLCTAQTHPPHHHHTHWGQVQDNGNPMAALREKRGMT